MDSDPTQRPASVRTMTLGGRGRDAHTNGALQVGRHARAAHVAEDTPDGEDEAGPGRRVAAVENGIKERLEQRRHKARPHRRRQPAERLRCGNTLQRVRKN
jgi:hypothetical protein